MFSEEGERRERGDYGERGYGDQHQTAGIFWVVVFVIVVTEHSGGM